MTRPDLPRDKLNLSCGVTAKPLVSRLHRVEKLVESLNITKIWQLRRRENPKAEIAETKQKRLTIN